MSGGTPRMTKLKPIERCEEKVYVAVTASDLRALDRHVEVLRSAGVAAASRSLLARLALSDLSDETVRRFAQGMLALEEVKRTA
jgi:hypothetical protein